MLHGVRLKGMATPVAIAQRFGLSLDDVEELLLDYQATGWVSHSEFAGIGGWSLTAAGRNENERQLAAELTAYDLRDRLVRVHETFADANGRFLRAITRWQVRPESWDAMARNDHTDWKWDDRVLRSLTSLARELSEMDDGLSALERMSGYPERFAAALSRANEGQNRWVDEPGIDSCHTVWFELHEDLLATLGLERGADR